MVVTPAVGCWGYAEGNPTLVGIVVVIISIAAVGYVVRRFWNRK
jgi:hypothetical protein